MSARNGRGTASSNVPPRTPHEGVSIIGLGASGRAAAQLALARGETVYVSDFRTEARLETAARELRELGARVELGGHDVERIADAAVVVVSPGIPPHAPVLRELRSRQVEWIGEPEFALGFHPGSLIAVTGTNGKTTTALLVGHLLAEAGIDAAVGGNVGGGLAPAASELLLERPEVDWLVLEMSSFQLADTRDFAPDIGVVTSLAPDHLDRYPDVETYWADKARLFRNATAPSRWVLNGDSSHVLALPGDAPGHRHVFSAADRPGSAPSDLPGDRPAARMSDRSLALEHRDGTVEPLAAAGELALLGRHNRANALAAVLTAHLAGAEPAALARGLRSFRPLPHRMEPVAEIDGVLWVNDSKATNVEAASAALESLDRPLVVLLGGKDKGEDFAPLGRALARSTRAAVLFGEARGRLEAELAGTGSDAAPCAVIREDRGFDRAVRAGASRCSTGDLLLLSPACSSFDEFENYEARGRRFVELAEQARASAAGEAS